MKISFKTASAVFLLLLAVIITVVLIKLANPVSDIQFLGKVIGKELQPSGDSLTVFKEYGFVNYCEELKEISNTKQVSINLYADKDQQEGLQKTEKIIKRFCPNDANEIMVAIRKSIELAKERKYINGYPFFKMNRPENSTSVEVVNWRNETGRVNTCIYLHIPKGDVS